MADEKRGLVATPAARDRAIEQLQDHYARSHLELAEFERRVELAERATAAAQLVALCAGLPSFDAALVPAGKVTSTIGATLGSTSRRGRWRVPSYVRVRALLGSVELDLCDAELGRGDTP